MEGALVIVGPGSSIEGLQPLMDYHGKKRPVVCVETAANVPVDDEFWLACLTGTEAAVLLLYDERYAPSRAVSGVSVPAANGQRIPVGVMPQTPGLGLVARRIVTATQRRAEQPLGPVALLGERGLNVSRELTSSELLLDASGAPVYRWDAERVLKPTLFSAIRAGVGIAMYRGRGTIRGWTGYGGIWSDDLQDNPTGLPVSALFALTCSSASRFRVSRSFVEACILKGYALSGLAAVGQTLTSSNRRLGDRIARILASERCRTMADVVQNVGLDHAWLRRYRLFGDPLAPLAGDPAAIDNCNAVYAPAPHIPLTPLSETLWPRTQPM
jgi:hypothetical protein